MPALILYLLAYVVLPFPSSWRNVNAPAACACPMCTIDANGVHHCPCCDQGNECNCAMSTGDDEDDAVMVTLLDAAALPPQQPLDVELRCSRESSESSQAVASRDLQVAVPPPKA
jgi:hypothetical protein